jgi:hypothetical protein
MTTMLRGYPCGRSGVSCRIDVRLFDVEIFCFSGVKALRLRAMPSLLAGESRRAGSGLAHQYRSNLPDFSGDRMDVSCRATCTHHRGLQSRLNKLLWRTRFSPLAAIAKAKAGQVGAYASVMVLSSGRRHRRSE